MPARFFPTFLLVSLFCAALSYLPPLQPYFWFAIANIVAYNMFYTLIIWLAQRAVRSRDKNLLTRLMLSSLFLKMMVALMVFIVYFKTQSPTGFLFLVPFFVIYVIYSIFGIRFLISEKL
jgi:hypothetical protein